MRQKEECGEWGPGSRPWGSRAGERGGAAKASGRGGGAPRGAGSRGAWMERRGREGEAHVKDEPRGPGPASGWCFALGVSGQEARQARKRRVHGESPVGRQGAGDAGTRNGGDSRRGARRRSGRLSGARRRGRCRTWGREARPPFNARR